MEGTYEGHDYIVFTVKPDEWQVKIGLEILPATWNSKGAAIAGAEVEIRRRTAPMVMYHGLLDMQVCVPESWTDEQVKTFAEEKIPCGTEGGWHIRRQGNPDLVGMPERNPCLGRKNYVHIMLDA